LLACALLSLLCPGPAFPADREGGDDPGGSTELPHTHPTIPCKIEGLGCTDENGDPCGKIRTFVKVLFDVDANVDSPGLPRSFSHCGFNLLPNGKIGPGCGLPAARKDATACTGPVEL
jgi:hypothetical protein